jgi:hypothetical protein
VARPTDAQIRCLGRNRVLNEGNFIIFDMQNTVLREWLLGSRLSASGLNENRDNSSFFQKFRTMMAVEKW